MNTRELRPIVLEDGSADVVDFLAGSDEIASPYLPEISCSSVGGAVCKDGCIGGCKDTIKSGSDCSKSSCKPGCQESCKDGCSGGCKTACKDGNKDG